MKKRNIAVATVQSTLVISSVALVLYGDWRAGVLVLLVDIIIGYHWQNYLKKKGYK